MHQCFGGGVRDGNEYSSSEDVLFKDFIYFDCTDNKI